jgi:hypothetical protein
VVNWVPHMVLHIEYPDKRCGADVKKNGSYLTTRNHRSVLVGDSNTLVLSSSICSSKPPILETPGYSHGEEKMAARRQEKRLTIDIFPYI